MCKILLITPPFLQPNTPYPATAYLKGYLAARGIDARQADLSVEVLNDIFSSEFLKDVFDNFASDDETEDNIMRIYSLRRDYISTIDVVMRFLRGEDATLASLICSADFLPQASRFDAIADVAEIFGSMGQQDCAKYLATLYLQDISDFIRATVSEDFEIVKYAESLTLSVPEYSKIQQILNQPFNAIEQLMCRRLREKMEQYEPEYVGFSVPFPGNLLAALRCGRYIKTNFLTVKVLIGGGYPTTELRNMTDDGIFGCTDYVVLDDGELATERILAGGELIHTYTAEGYHDNSATVSHEERGCPDFSDLPFDKYFSLCEITNPMHRLWSDGRWNKMILAHGCYWAKCAFCDTELDYIRCFDSVKAETFVDWMERVAVQTGSYGFHFVDEAASPKLLKEISLEILRRGLKFSWWTNIRFEKAFTGDLCRLMAAAGCIAVSGGLETANDRLLGLINKGVDIEQATIAMRNFYYAGIMVHTYLMYGFPTETLQDTIDSLEVVRQMFRAQLIDSAFWHRYAMTLYSRSGTHPDEYGVRRKGSFLNPFANNEVAFSENRGYSLDMVGEGLRLSLANYMAGQGLERGVHKWFEGKVPQTTIENTLITDALIKPDGCRIYSPTARLVWLGGEVMLTEKGLLAITRTEEKEIKFKESDAEFLMQVIEQCADLNNDVRFDDVKEFYTQFSEEPFLVLYHSKQWDILRKMGLLQI